MPKRGRPRKYEEKTVIRSYYSKKLKKTVTKTYSYGRDVYKYNKPKEIKEVRKHRSYQSKIVAKSGKIYSKRYNEFYNSFTTIEERSDIKDIVDNYQKGHRILTESKLLFELNKQKIFSALDNTGFTLEQIAEEIDTTVDELTNLNNWNDVQLKSGKIIKGSIFTNPKNGIRYQYEWSYNLSTVMNRIN